MRCEVHYIDDVMQMRQSCYCLEMVLREERRGGRRVMFTEPRGDVETRVVE